MAIKDAKHEHVLTSQALLDDPRILHTTTIVTCIMGPMHTAQVKLQGTRASYASTACKMAWGPVDHQLVTQSVLAQALRNSFIMLHAPANQICPGTVSRTHRAGVTPQSLQRL